MKVVFFGVLHHYLYSKVSKSFGKTPPINLASLAAFLLDKDFKVKILDPAVDGITMEDLPKYFPKDFDVIGVSSLTPTITQSAEILKIAKRINPRCITIMGEPHLSALPNRTMSEFPCIDYGIVGEGEITLFELLKALTQNKDISQVKGLVYRSNGNWSNRTFLPNESVLNTPYLSSRDLKLMLKKTYIRFYFNPRFILKCIMDVRSLKKIKFYYKGLIMLISILLKKK